MARTCVLTADDQTPAYGQQVVITATFENDGAEVTIDDVQPLFGPGVAGFYEQMQQNLVGETLPAGTSTFTFPIVLLTGQPDTFVVAVDCAVHLSDAAVINATGVEITVAAPVLPGGTFPE